MSETREWMPIETAPRDGRIILVSFPDPSRLHGQFVAYWCDECDEWKFHVAGVVRGATHWMPLPQPPQVPHD